jgi:hypothetical protein
MGRPTLQSRLKDAESLVQRLEENIAFQGRMIATLDRGGHDVKGGKDVPEAAAGYARETRRRQGPIVQGTGEPLIGPSVEGREQWNIMDKRPESLAAELEQQGAHLMALELMLVSLLEANAPPGNQAFVASVLNEAASNAKLLADRGVPGADTDIHMTRILRIIRQTEENLGLRNAVP